MYQCCVEFIDALFPLTAKVDSNLDASQVTNIGMIEIAAEMLEVVQYVFYGAKLFCMPSKMYHVRRYIDIIVEFFVAHIFQFQTCLMTGSNECALLERGFG